MRFLFLMPIGLTLSCTRQNLFNMHPFLGTPFLNSFIHTYYNIASKFNFNKINTLWFASLTTKIPVFSFSSDLGRD